MNTLLSKESCIPAAEERALFFLGDFNCIIPGPRFLFQLHVDPIQSHSRPAATGNQGPSCQHAFGGSERLDQGAIVNRSMFVHKMIIQISLVKVKQF